MNGVIDSVAKFSDTLTTMRPAARNLGTYSNIVDEATIRHILLSSGEMNFVDKVAYPHIPALEQEVVRFLLGNVHADSNASGFAATGSSEAIILALAHHQRNFIDTRPELKNQDLNFVISEAHHKAFEKYARLFGVELRVTPLNESLAIDTTAMERLIDDKTFCVVGIAGSTELGKVDDITAICKLARKHKIPVHIDAAIGGFVFPFLATKQLWDFALPEVQSMNISGHKYGLCLPGIGFLLVRTPSVMPKGYLENSEIAYLSGGTVVDYALTCSRSAAFVVNAHHNLKQYGQAGYSAIAKQNQANASYFARELKKINGVTDVIQGDAPVINFTGKDIGGLSTYLAEKGWIQSPHHIQALNQRHIRIAIRRHITHDLLQVLLADIANFYLVRASRSFKLCTPGKSSIASGCAPKS